MKTVSFLQKTLDGLAEVLNRHTAGFMNTKAGKVFGWLMVIGPATLLPTVWEAWSADNIDALRTLTWPLMIIVDLSFFLNVCKNGDWKIRLTVLLWIMMAAVIWLATLVR